MRREETNSKNESFKILKIMRASSLKGGQVNYCESEQRDFVAAHKVQYLKIMDLSQFMHAAADAAKSQLDEFKGHMSEVVSSMEREMEEMRRNHETTLNSAVGQVENEARVEIERIQREVYNEMKAFEDDTMKAAQLEIQNKCAAMKESLEAQYQAQRDDLTTECELILQEKDEEYQRHLQHVEQQHQLELQRQLETLQRQHDMEVEALKNEVWNAVNQEMAIESEQMIKKVVSEGEEKCRLLQHELECVHRQLQERDMQLQSTVDNMQELDDAFVDVAREVNARHQSEIDRLSEEMLMFERENSRLDGENAMIREEVLHLRSMCKATERKNLEQEEVIHRLEQRHTVTIHRSADSQSCKQLLEKQIEELKSENASLTKAREQIFELTAENKEQASKVSALREQSAKYIDEIDNLKVECKQLRRQYAEANELIDTLEKDERELAQEMQHRLRHKEEQLQQLTEAVDAMAKKSEVKAEPVVVHLNDNNGRQISNSECHHLRSRVLELQRMNYRLESDLAEAKRESQTRMRVVQDTDNKDSASIHQLREESNALKQIISSMRSEMEKMLPPTNGSENEEGMSSSYILALEQQLVQCRAYLDILLKSRGVDRKSGDDNDDELYFLRSRYQELHEILDQVREENFR